MCDSVAEGCLLTLDQDLLQSGVLNQRKLLAQSQTLRLGLALRKREATATVRRAQAARAKSHEEGYP